MASSDFTDSVYSVLSDTQNLPQEFVNYLIQNAALNPLPDAKNPGERIASAIQTSNVTTTGTTFAAGADVLATAIEFTAQGNVTYTVKIMGLGWQNSASGNTMDLKLNLDGSDGGFMAAVTSAGASYYLPLFGIARFQAPAGSHSVNVRMITSGGTATIAAGTGGGAANNEPVVVTLEVA